LWKRKVLLGVPVVIAMGVAVNSALPDSRDGRRLRNVMEGKIRLCRSALR